MTPGGRRDKTGKPKPRREPSHPARATPADGRGSGPAPHATNSRDPDGQVQGSNAPKGEGMWAKIVIGIVVAIVGAVAGAFATPFAGDVRDFIRAPFAGSSPDEPDKTAPTPGVPFDSQLDGKAFHGLESPKPGVRKNTVTKIGAALTNSAETASARRAALVRLAAFVRDRDPKYTKSETLAYCVDESHDGRYPSDVALAIQAIGRRLEEDVSVRLNLSNVNLSWENWTGLDLRNIGFDGALLCRTILNESRFDGATFRGANLRFCFMDTSTGWTESQLAVAASIFRSRLPSDLKISPTMQRRLEADPEWDGSSDVHST